MNGRHASLLLAALLLAAASPALAAKKSKKTKPKPAQQELELALDAPSDELSLEELPLETPPAEKPAEKPPAAVVEAPPPPPPVIVETPVPVPAEPAPEEPPAFAGPRLKVTPTTGFGYTSQSALGSSTPVFAAGIDASYRFTRDSSLALGFGDQLYTRRYLTTRPSFGGARPFLEVSEQKLAVDLLYSHELLPLFGVKDSRPALAVTAGPASRFFLNDVIRSQAAGVAIGGRFSFAPSDALDVSLGGTWTYNLLPFAVATANAPLDAHGGLVAFSAYEGAVGLRLAPGTRFRIGYGGELHTLASAYRFFHTLSFSFDVHL